MSYKVRWHLLMTPGEGEIAFAQELLAGKQVCYRQYEVGPYYVDIALPEYKIAIEVDDKNKRRGRAKRRRQIRRDDYLNRQGWKVVQVLNTADPKIIWDVLEQAITESPSI